MGRAARPSASGERGEGSGRPVAKQKVRSEAEPDGESCPISPQRQNRERREGDKETNGGTRRRAGANRTAGCVQ